MAENELPEPESVKLFEGMTGGDGGAIPTYDVTIRVRRYNPEVSDEAYWDDFKMQMYRTKPITVEPIKGLPCEKDLIVDMEPFFQAYREIMPFFINDSNEPERERLQTIEDRARFDDTTKCILCAACTSSCPVFWTDGQYFGPSAIVNAHRFIFDSRDDAGDLRLEILNDKEGVWRCRTTFNCTEACPRGIQITKAIAEVKQAILARSL